MARDYYKLEFWTNQLMSLPLSRHCAFFDDVLDASVEELNFKTITDGLGGVLYQYPFNVPGYYALILRSLTVLEGLRSARIRSLKCWGSVSLHGATT